MHLYQGEPGPCCGSCNGLYRWIAHIRGSSIVGICNSEPPEQSEQKILAIQSDRRGKASSPQLTRDPRTRIGVAHLRRLACHPKLARKCRRAKDGGLSGTSFAT